MLPKSPLVNVTHKSYHGLVVLLFQIRRTNRYMEKVLKLSSMMILSSILATIFTILGLGISYAYDISSGASIIIVAVVILTIVKLIKRK